MMKSHSKSNCSNISGFTLLEALVAIALTGLILSAVAAITAQWLPNWDRGFARVQGSETLALGLDRLTADVAAAEFVPANRETQRPFFEGTDHSITFVRSALAPNAPAGLEIVRIVGTSSVAGPSLLRTRAPFFPSAKGSSYQPKFGDPVVLLRAPYLVSFAYAGMDRSWKDAWLQESLLPQAIRVILRDTRTRREFGASTATVIHAGVPATCISSKSFDDCLTSLKPKSQSASAEPPSLQAVKIP
jgi:general secretion pathway protein J